MTLGGGEGGSATRLSNETIGIPAHPDATGGGRSAQAEESAEEIRMESELDWMALPKAPYPWESFVRCTQ